MCIFACYDIPNVLIDGYDVVVNKPATSAYRRPGATNAAFAAETVVDEICEQLKIDPLEFRIRNGAREGTRRADGPVYPAHRHGRDGRGGQEAPALPVAARFKPRLSDSAASGSPVWTGTSAAAASPRASGSTSA